MKFLLQILFLVFTWFSSSATSTISKVVLPNYAVSFSKTANQKLESELKIGVSIPMEIGIERSGISENSFSQKEIFWKSSVLENRARVRSVKGVSGAGKTGIKIVDDFIETVPKINSITNADLPAGYQIFTKNGSKYIRRVDVNNVNTPRLMVDEAGTIVPYVKPQRLANSTKLRSNLENNLGITAPANHQAHHLVPSNVVENSALHKEAMKRGLYDVDRAGNGKFLAETDEDLLLPGASVDLPTHLGSHPNYDVVVRQQIDIYENALKTKYGSINNIPSVELEKAMDLIESDALSVLKNWFPSKLN
jgi:hypothetical protein